MRNALTLAFLLALLSAWMANPALAVTPDGGAVEAAAEAVAAVPAVGAPAPRLDPLLVRVIGMFVIAFIVWALGQWKAVFGKIPRVFLPVLAMVVGVGLQYGANYLGWTPSDVEGLRIALEGAIGGLAGAGTWSLGAPVRKGLQGAKPASTEGQAEPQA